MFLGAVIRNAVKIPVFYKKNAIVQFSADICEVFSTIAVLDFIG